MHPALKIVLDVVVALVLYLVPGYLLLARVEFPALRASIGSWLRFRFHW